jgi:hypothetical protein
LIASCASNSSRSMMFYIGFRDVHHAQIGLAVHEGEDVGL